jgi:aminoglycoside 3-N-acetyltransferase
MSENPSLEQSFLSELADIGISDGDFVMAHSRVGTAPLPEVVGCLNALIRSVEPTGTLAIPTFNFAFCRGVAYDYRKTPSEMGLLTEFARRDRRAQRIHHPVYSFALFGKEQMSWRKPHTTLSRSGMTPFLASCDVATGRSMRIDLKIHETLTFFHHIEEMVGCD